MSFDSLVDYMMDELKDAEKYASDAASCDNPDNKKILAEMSRQELTHYHNLWKMADDLTKNTMNGEKSTNFAILHFLTKKFTDWENRIQFSLSKIK